MFGFLKLQSSDRDGPLRSPAAANAWLQSLPFEDASMRQRRVLAAVEDFPRSCEGAMERDRIAALIFLDSAAEPDRRRLVAQYIANADRSPNVANALWETLDRENRAFAAAYRSAIESAGATGKAPSRDVPIARLAARFIRCLGIDAKLQAFHYQRWIPAKWYELNTCYRFAAGHGVERAPLPRDDKEADALHLTVEQEYLAVLLVHRVDSGNLAPSELDFVSERLRQGARDLVLTNGPRSAHDFFVDTASRGGLDRGVAAPGPAIRYLDATMLVAHLRRELAAMARHRSTAPGLSDRQRESRITTLDRTWRALASASGTDLRGARREPATIHATVRFGLADICAGLSAGTEWNEAGMPAGATRVSSTLAATLADLESIGRQPGSPRSVRKEPASTAAHGVARSAPRSGWTVVDRSIAGLRIRGSIDAARGLAVGALAAVHVLESGESVLGVVCRLCRVSGDSIEAGLSMVAGRVVAATLHTQCAARDDMHIVVDGIDLSAMGVIFRGLYVPPKVGPDTAHHGGTLIVPTSNHDAGRRVVLATGDEVCTVILREPLERAGDWTWTTFEVALPEPALAMAV